MRFPLSMVMAALLVVPACKRSEPRTVHAASEEPTYAVEGMKTERSDYVEAISDRLGVLEHEIDELDQRANAMNGTTKASARKSIDCLRNQRKSVAAKLDNLKKADVESWRTLSSDVNCAMAHLERSYTQVSDMMY